MKVGLDRIVHHYHYIKIIVVRPSVCPQGGHRKWPDPEPRAAASLGYGRLRARARLPLCTLGKVLTTGKATSKFNVMDKELRVDTYFSRSPDGEGGRFMAND